MSITTDISYWSVCDRMSASFREHTYSFCDYYISSGFLNGKETNANALNISSGS